MIVHAMVLDTPGGFGDPEGLRAEECALVVRDGVIVARTDRATAAATYPGEEVVHLGEGVLLPGLVDTHVHFPQIRAIGGLGMGLLRWLEERALPEESRLAQDAYARAVAAEFLAALVGSGTTTALVFGSHFASAVDILFGQAERAGLRLTTGLVVSDRELREDLLCTPGEALTAGQDLATRWHGRGRLRYAVTPRFSLSASDAMLDSCAQLLAWGQDRFGTADGARPDGTGPGGLWFTSHLNETREEIAAVRDFFPRDAHYTGTYERHGLLGPQAVLAHNVHPTAAELDALAGAGAVVAHCPSSNFALGSGLFPLAAHQRAGVRVAMGTDVGAGTGFCLLKEGLQAYFAQQLREEDGADLAAADLLHLITRSGAQALGMGEQVGDLSVGKEFDAVWIRPRHGGTLQATLPYATDATDALAKIFTMGSPADIAGVWVGGERIGPTLAPTDGEHLEHADATAGRSALWGTSAGPRASADPGASAGAGTSAGPRASAEPVAARWAAPAGPNPSTPQGDQG